MRFVVCTAIALTCATLQAQSPPGNPQFEVASVKPSVADNMPAKVREMMRNNRAPGSIPKAGPGRIRLERWALLDLIAAAYKVRASQVSGPSWLSDQSFDIEAKLPEGTANEQINPMLQSLLEERFGLKVHRETQTKQGFALIVGKNGPKLKLAELPPADSPDLTPEQRRERMQARMADMMKRMQETRENGAVVGPARSANWESVTSEELANHLTAFTEAPVVDETHLTGKYSVYIATWTSPDVPGGTIFDAVEKLGLKLEPRKILIETIVVDQVSKSPTAN